MRKITVVATAIVVAGERVRQASCAWLVALCLVLPLAAGGGDLEAKAVLEHVPPLTHDAAGRLPLILWPRLVLDGKDALPADMIRELAARGLTQRLSGLCTNNLAEARAIQEAGAAVVFIEGECGRGPYMEGPDPLHHLPEDFKIVKGTGYAGQDHFPCIGLYEGWRRRADRLREALKVYKEAGVHITAVWLDWEIEPHATQVRYDQARACSRCQSILPKDVLSSEDRYFAYATQLRADLYSAYVAVPILEYYPGCSVANWAMVISSAEHRTPGLWWHDDFFHVDLGLMTAGNPVAYGWTIYYSKYWQKDWFGAKVLPAWLERFDNDWDYPLDVPRMDRLYTHIMLGQISGHAKNAATIAPSIQTIPWVCRYCPSENDDNVPILSRPRYREILRHIWLRGADSMQIFNEPYPKHPHPDIPIQEVEDAVAVYDEMLAFREFLDAGVVMNTEIYAVTHDGAIWSGLRLENEAVVRAFTQASKPVTFNLSIAGHAIELEAPPQGATYRIGLKGGEPVVLDGWWHLQFGLGQHAEVARDLPRGKHVISLRAISSPTLKAPPVDDYGGFRVTEVLIAGRCRGGLSF